MVLPALLLATSVALSFSPIKAPGAGTHWHSPPATQVDRGHPSGWYVLVRPQHRRLGPSAAPAQPRILQPGLLLHSASERRGAWIRCYDPAGQSWVWAENLRPATEPRGWDKLVVKIHPALRHVRTVSHLPSPLSVAPRAAVTSAAAPVATPAVAPQATAVPQVVPPAARTPIQSIYFWSSYYGADPNLMLAIARCESNYSPTAYNPSGASGMYQFMGPTWAAYSAQLSWDHTPSVWNADDAARVASYMIGRLGQQRQWSCYYVTQLGYNPDNG